MAGLFQGGDQMHALVLARCRLLEGRCNFVNRHDGRSVSVDRQDVAKALREVRATSARVLRLRLTSGGLGLIRMRTHRRDRSQSRLRNCRKRLGPKANDDAGETEQSGKSWL